MLSEEATWACASSLEDLTPLCVHASISLLVTELLHLFTKNVLACFESGTILGARDKVASGKGKALGLGDNK